MDDEARRAPASGQPKWATLPLSHSISMSSRPIFSYSSAWTALSLLALATPAVAEECLGAVEERLLPLADLDGMDLVRVGEFGAGLGLPGGLQGDPGLEGGRVALACAGHDAPRDGTATFDQFNLPSYPVSRV